MHDTVAEMTVEQFREMVRSVVKEVLGEMLGDPDEGLPLRDDVAEMLRESLARQRAGTLETKTADKVAAELGLDW